MAAACVWVGTSPLAAQAPGPAQPSASLPDAPAPANDPAPPRDPAPPHDPATLPAGNDERPKGPTPYTPTAETAELHNYLYEAFGPYPLVISTLVAGYHQARRNPPDWREGMAGYEERFASDFGISVINISTRYTLAEALDEDVYYYRCGCTGAWPRLRHALASVVVARNRITGRPAFALPGVVAPYAGPLVAVRTWYPDRYELKDGFRMGNYGLLDYAIGNIGLEFLPSLTHGAGKSIVRRFHLENRHATANVHAP